MRFLLLLLLTGLALAEGPRVLTLDDHSKNLQLAVGDKISVKLPSNPSTGYAWYLYYKNSQLKRLGKPVYVPTVKGKPKLGGSVTYSFQVGGEFDDSLELRYIQPNAKKPKPLRTFIVHLRTGASDS